MTNGDNTTTISIELQANEVLNTLAKYHNTSKVGFVSSLILALATLDEEQIEGLLAGGRITKILLTLGAKVEYPKGITLKDTYAPLPLLRIITKSIEGD